MKFFLALFLAAALLTGCAPQPTAAPTAAPTVLPPTAAPAAQSGPTAAAQPAGTLFQVIKPDGSAVPITLDDLKKMPLGQVNLDGKVQEGPKVLDVLAKAGVTDFKEVTFEGSSSPVTLKREQVNDQTIFDYANRGTVKLATSAVPFAQLTKDVSRIVVK
jgi:hypothetical protein